MKYVKIILILSILWQGGTLLAATTTSDTINVNLSVTFCNMNSTCEASLGETAANCPTDCSATTVGSTGGGGVTPDGGGASIFSIYDVIIIPSATSTFIFWRTTLPAISTFSIGRTLAYEEGVLTETDASTVHGVFLSELDPEVVYYISISVYDVTAPSKIAIYLGSFTTLREVLAVDTAPLYLDAVYIRPSKGIDLTWKRVSGIDDFRVVRSTAGFIEDPSMGDLIYEGSGEHAFDPEVLEGVTYYYTLFQRDSAGKFSFPTVDLERVPTADEITEEIDKILDKLPDSLLDGHEVESLVLRITQGTETWDFRSGDRLSLDGQLLTKFYIPYEDLPEVLKTIVVTLRHPSDNDRSFSFLLRIDKNKKEYSATIGSLVDSGDYSMGLYLLDHSSARLRTVKGTLSVERGGLAGYTKTITRVSNFFSSSGLLVSVGNLIITTTRARSLMDFYLILMRGAGSLLGILGFRRRRVSWGTVYDSITKRPLDPAYVVAYSRDKTGKLGTKPVAEAITDLDGRFGFLLQSGHYVISAAKTHYQFPSHILAGKSEDEIYGSLYHGGELVNTEGEVIMRNIPLDPVGLDWNEFTKNKMKLFNVYSKRERFKALFLDSIFVAGFLFTLLATIISPPLVNFVILLTYIVLLTSQQIIGRRHRAFIIKSGATGQPYPFAIIRIFLANLNQEIKRLVADEMGRFYLLVTPGRYYFTVDAKEDDGSYKRAYRSETINLPKGVLDADIVVP